jgi:hypothetical protein
MSKTAGFGQKRENKSVPFFLPFAKGHAKNNSRQAIDLFIKNRNRRPHPIYILSISTEKTDTNRIRQPYKKPEEERVSQRKLILTTRNSRSQ